jgi:hypothetical protein
MRRVVILTAVLLACALGAVAQAAVPHLSPFPGIAVADKTAQLPQTAARTSTLGVSAAYFTDPVAAALAIGNRLVTLQSDVTEDNAGNGNPDSPVDGNDGGWDWYTTGQSYHASDGSYENLYGPIAAGLAEAAIFTSDARLATGIGDVFSGISQDGLGLLNTPYFGIWDGGIATAYVRWGDHTGNAVLKDTIKVRHDSGLLLRGGAGGRSRTVCLGRRSQGLAGMWPWDILGLAQDSKALAGAFTASAATYEAEVDSIAQVILDDMNDLLGTGGWDPTDFTQNYHQMGLVGAMEVFDLSPRSDDDALATALRDSLVNGQQPDGSWGCSYGGYFYEQDVQTTAYAVMGLTRYAQRHGDAAALHTAFLGQQWLLNTVSASGIVDAGGGLECPEVSAEVASALLLGDAVTPVPPTTCITPAYTCVAVPVTVDRVDTTPVRGFTVDIALGGGLALCGAGIAEGTYLNSVGTTAFQVVDNGGGAYTVDCAILGGSAGAVGAGTLFTLNLAAAGTGIGTVTVTAVQMRDLVNRSVPAIPGDAATITIDNSNPTAIADLAAAQVKTGNDGDGTTKIALTFTAPGDAAAVEVYRAPYGNYPEYNDAPNAGAAPGVPSYPPGAPWSLTAVTASGQTDEFGPCMLGTSHLEVAGTYAGTNWTDPRTNYAYRLSGVAVGKNNHNVPPGPPTGAPTGSLDPNLATIEYFRMPAGGTLTIAGSFTTPLTVSNFTSTTPDEYLTVGLVNKPWVDVASGGYNSYMFNTPQTGFGTKGNAYLVFYRNGSVVRTAMEYYNSGNVTSPDQRAVASVSSFSIQFQDGLDKDGNVVAVGGRMRYALDGGAYGPWDTYLRDFRELTALQLGAYTVSGGVVAADFGPVCSTLRDFWYYVAFAKDECGNVSAVSNMTAGTLNYHLGDVMAGGTVCAGDNVVNMPDISLLGGHYGVVEGNALYLACLDVGPTTDRYVDALPTTDNKINFEDLMMFAINYETAYMTMPPVAAVASDAVWVEGPAKVTAGQTFTVSLRMSGSGALLGLSANLGWDRAVAELVSIEAGELVTSQGGVVLSPGGGLVDCALLGADRRLVGEGDLARVTFRALANGAPQVAVAAVDARDAANRMVELTGTPPTVVPAVTSFAPAMPNPFRGTTTLSYALAKGGAVELTVYGVDGRKVATLASGVQEAGSYRLVWDGGNARPGLYYARLTTPQGKFTRTLVLVK